MKLLIVMLAFTAGINALPSREHKHSSERVPRFIKGLLDDFIQVIIDAGLDPYKVHNASYSRKPIPGILAIDTSISNLKFTGLSNIVVNKFTTKSLKFNVDVLIPELVLSVGNASVQVDVVGQENDANGRGELAIIKPQVAASVDFISNVFGLSVNKVYVDLSVGRIFSDVEISVLGIDVSKKFDKLMSETIPHILAKYKDTINKVLSVGVRSVLEVVI